MIFSHGAGGAKGIYQLVGQEYASNGYIIFLIDHLDGSCVYTELKDGTKINFNSNLPDHDFEWYKFEKYMLMREEECKLLLDDICVKGFA